MNFKNRTNELNTYEAELNRLIEAENDKQWETKAAVWKNEEVNKKNIFKFFFKKDKRIKLMHEVYDSRKVDIERKS